MAFISPCWNVSSHAAREID